VVLPLVLLVAVVGGSTYIAQFLPRWTRKEQSVEAVKGEALTFPQKVVLWDATDPTYLAEFESESDGQHVFWCENPGQQTAELGLIKKSCTCSQVDVCVLEPEEARRYKETRDLQQNFQARAAAPGPVGQGSLVELINFAVAGKDGVGGLLGQGLTWRKLEPGKDGVVVPARAAGLVRVSWKGRNREDVQVGLSAELWSQFQGRPGSRQDVRLQTQVAFVPAVRLLPANGEIEVDWDSKNVGRAEFRCWSSTRPAFSLAAQVVPADPCIPAPECTPLTAAECRQLERDARDLPQPPSRVLSGYRVTVTVYQEKGKAQLEHGRFERTIQLTSDVPTKLPALRVTGRFKGDVTIAGKHADNGIVKLGNFRASEGKNIDDFPVEIRVTDGVELLRNKIEVEPEDMKKAMKVALKPIPKGEAGTPNGWRMYITVGPDVNAWPADCAIILYTRQGQRERRVRIPVEAKPYD
jgi:hypothetical protein